MSSLEERLKKLRQSALTTNDNTQVIAEPSHASDPVNQDEVDDLLRQTGQLVAVEKEQGTSPYSTDDVEAWLAQDSGGEEGEEDDRVNVEERSNIIDKGILRQFETEGSRMTKEAEAALRDLHNEGSWSEAKSLLQVEPKAKPTLSRTPSNQSPIKASLSLEDDLADAMAGDVGEKEKVGQVQDHESSLEASTSTKEVDELTARLASLRSGVRKEDDAEVADCAFQFDLPSAPSTKPITISRDISGENDWKSKHGVEGRDLSSYEALVRLNATVLGAPSEKTTAKAKQVKERDETDDWCCICNEDAVVSCLGCDADLYCQNCWNEGHLEMDKEERAEHRTKLFARGRKPVAAG